MKTNQQYKRQKGLTFIEVMIVLIILGAIAALVGPALFSKVGDAKIKQAKIQMKSIKNALDMYHMDNSSYPDDEQGLEALIMRPDVGRETPNWRGPYLNSKQVPLDPWNNNYEYIFQGSTFVLRSLGADMAEGGEGENADIYAD